MKKIFITFIIASLLLIYPENKSDQKDLSVVERYKEILTYGIDSEVVNILPNLGTSPNKEFYPILLDRYKNSNQDEVKVKLADFFSNCDNLPDSITDAIYSDVKREPSNVKLHTALLGVISKKGKTEEQKILVERLDFLNDTVKNASADFLSRMTDPELAPLILNRLEVSEKDNEKFLSNDIKAKLILALGKMKSKESLEYLKNAASEESNDKYIIMFSMVSLAEMQDEESIEIMKKNLGSDEISIQEYASYSLSKYKSNKVLPILKDMLKNNNEKIRSFACQGMVSNFDAETLKILLYKAKNDPSESIRNQALTSLIQIGNAGINELKDAMKGKDFSDNDLHVMSLAVVNKPDASGVDFILSLYDKLEKKKKDIIAKNIITGTSNLLDRITALLLKSDDPLVRINALKTVFQTKDSSLWPEVNEISEKDSNDNVKKIAKGYLELRSK